MVTVCCIQLTAPSLERRRLCNKTVACVETQLTTATYWNAGLQWPLQTKQEAMITMATTLSFLLSVTDSWSWLLSEPVSLQIASGSDSGDGSLAGVPSLL